MSKVGHRILSVEEFEQDTEETKCSGKDSSDLEGLQVLFVEFFPLSQYCYLSSYFHFLP